MLFLAMHLMPICCRCCCLVDTNPVQRGDRQEAEQRDEMDRGMELRWTVEWDLRWTVEWDLSTEKLWFLASVWMEE